MIVPQEFYPDRQYTTRVIRARVLRDSRYKTKEKRGFDPLRSSFNRERMDGTFRNSIEQDETFTLMDPMCT